MTPFVPHYPPISLSFTTFIKVKHEIRNPFDLISLHSNY
jgi:hypothetical protein